ncbi:hypothetical protein PVK06_048462 [Gossypium arboreum]|uniref:Uncharacterized protein n=1 Tax=Gossypium arboreum TaxID=29729 RepID=A0ABR0MG03_GOSAR|nr:hypothetical protein PVK06_048462 [Gossypium arboreum]
MKDDQSHLDITTQLNPIFEGPIELAVELNTKLLDSSKHSTITFKNQERPNIAKPTEAGILVGRGKEVLVSKGRESRTKGGIARNSGVISKLIRERKGNFKNSKSVRVSLSD